MNMQAVSNLSTQARHTGMATSCITTYGPDLTLDRITSSFVRDNLKAVFEFWQLHGVSSEGGFWNGVTIAEPHLPSPADQKSEFAQGRQIYAYCLAAKKFPDLREGLLEAAGGGVRFMCSHFWQDSMGNKGLAAAGEAGGWIVATDPAGNWVQPAMPSYLSNSDLKTPGNREVYEDAFVLLSFGQYFAETGDEAVLPWLAATMERLTNTRYFGRAAGGGFDEHASLEWELLPGAPRTQNSHMHLLEAFLTVYGATAEAAYLEEATGIVDLFFSKLFDTENGCIGEFFSADWTPDAAQGENVEPGHSFEWIWLLHEYFKRQPDDRIPAAMELLYAQAVRSLDGEFGGTYDQIRRGDGTFIKSTKRLWPQVERTKADAAMVEFSMAQGKRNVFAETQLREGLLYMFQKYAAPDGLWSDNHIRQGTMDPNETRINGPNVYHIAVALKEAERVLELVELAGPPHGTLVHTRAQPP